MSLTCCLLELIFEGHTNRKAGTNKGVLEPYLEKLLFHRRVPAVAIGGEPRDLNRWNMRLGAGYRPDAGEKGGTLAGAGRAGKGKHVAAGKHRKQLQIGFVERKRPLDDNGAFGA